MRLYAVVSKLFMIAIKTGGRRKEKKNGKTSDGE